MKFHYWMTVFNFFALQLIKLLFLSFQLKFHFNILWMVANSFQIPACVLRSFFLWVLLNPGDHPSNIGPSLLKFSGLLTYSVFHYLSKLLRSVDSEGVASSQWPEAHIISWAAGTRRTAPTTDRNYTLFRSLGTISALL